MTTEDFLLIQTLYEHKNISRTAQALYLAQPTVSKRLKLVEQEFGTVLVRRGKNGVEFTPEGEYLAVKASQIYAMVEETRQRLNQMSHEPRQTLIIGASNATIHASFPDLLRDFSARYPKIAIEIVNEKSSQLTRLIEQGKLDFGFVTGDVAFGGMRISISREEAYIGSVLPVQPDHLPQYPYLDYDMDPASRTILLKWWAEHYSQPFPSGLRVSGAAVARDLIMRELGYSFFFQRDYMAERTDAIHPLVYRDGSPVTRDNWCIYYEDRLVNRPEAQRFLKYIQKKAIMNTTKMAVR